MSGGHFAYNQYKIQMIEEDLEQSIIDNGRKKTKEELKEESYRGSDWYKKYPEDLYHYKYPDDIIKEFKRGLNYLKLARIYTQRIDWLLSGDNGEDSFREKLKKDLKDES